MAIRLDLPRSLRPLANGVESLDAVGLSLPEALALLADSAPRLREFLPGTGEHGERARLFRDGRLVRGPLEADGPLRDGEVLALVPPPQSVSLTADPPELSPDDMDRYARHVALPEVGKEGQRRLKGSSALVVGLGGLGSPLALYLAAAGIGRLGLLDDDVVEAPDLHRQVLHGTADLGRPKVESARERIHDLNPTIEVVEHAVRLTPGDALAILRDYDVIADATDNFPTRYLLSDACVLLGRPLVHGSVFRFEGQATVFCARGGPCYRCLFPEPPPPGLVLTSAEGGILGILPGVVGLLQATEVVKLLLDLGSPLAGRFVLYDALAMEFRTLTVLRDPTCPACGDVPAIDRLTDQGMRWSQFIPRVSP